MYEPLTPDEVKALESGTAQDIEKFMQDRDAEVQFARDRMRAASAILAIKEADTLAKERAARGPNFPKSQQIGGR